MEIEGLWTIKNHLKKKDYHSAPLRGAEVIINERRARKGKRLHTLHTSAHMVCAPLFVDMTGESDCYTHAHTEPNFFYRGENMAYVLYLSKYVLRCVHVCRIRTFH